MSAMCFLRYHTSSIPFTCGLGFGAWDSKGKPARPKQSCRPEPNLPGLWSTTVLVVVARNPRRETDTTAVIIS